MEKCVSANCERGGNPFLRIPCILWFCFGSSWCLCVLVVSPLPAADSESQPYLLPGLRISARPFPEFLPVRRKFEPQNGVFRLPLRSIRGEK